MDKVMYATIRNNSMVNVFSLFQKVNKEIEEHLERYNKLNGFPGAKAEAKFMFTKNGGPRYVLKMDGMDLIDTSKWFNEKLEELFDLGVRFTALFKDNRFSVSDISIHVYSRTLSEEELTVIAQKLSVEGPIEVSR